LQEIQFEKHINMLIWVSLIQIIIVSLIRWAKPL